MTAPWIESQHPCSHRQPTLPMVRARVLPTSQPLAQLAGRYLSPQERTRGEAMRRPADRIDYLCAHLLKRLVLARCLGIDQPHTLRCVPGRHGKPELQLTQGHAPHFNLSHTRGYVALVWSWQYPCGIDIEQPDDRPLNRHFLNATMTAREQQCILAADNPAAAFRQHWVCKEALLKAEGLGLYGELTALSTHNIGTAPTIRQSRLVSGQRLWTTRIDDYPLAVALAAAGTAERQPGYIRLELKRLDDNALAAMIMAHHDHPAMHARSAPWD